MLSGDGNIIAGYTIVSDMLTRRVVRHTVVCGASHSGVSHSGV